MRSTRRERERGRSEQMRTSAFVRYLAHEWVGGGANRVIPHRATSHHLLTEEQTKIATRHKPVRLRPHAFGDVTSYTEQLFRAPNPREVRGGIELLWEGDKEGAGSDPNFVIPMPLISNQRSVNAQSTQHLTGIQAPLQAPLPIAISMVAMPMAMPMTMSMTIPTSSERDGTVLCTKHTKK